MASRLSNAWEHNPPPTLPVLRSGRTYESPVTSDSRLRVRSSPQHSKRQAGCFKADMALCQIFLLESNWGHVTSHSVCVTFRDGIKQRERHAESV